MARVRKRNKINDGTERQKKGKRNKQRIIHQYSDQSLQEALKRIREQNLPIRQASREYNIPRGTLQDKIPGRTKDGPRQMGPGTVLTKDEEQRLVDWLKNLSACGFPQNPNGLLDAAQRIIHETRRETPFKNERPGKRWYYLFLKRHPQLSRRTPEGITRGQAVVTEETIRKWFSDLKGYLKSDNYEDVLEDPTRIFNLDETSFSLAPKTGYVLAPRGALNVYQVKCGNEKETLTVLLTFSANGEMLPPMIVYPYLRPPKALVENMPDNWALGRSEKGWMTAETFYAYIENNFNYWLQKNNVKRPIILFLDGHKSHMSIQLNEFCSQHQIILYCLPPNTTHILQPADVGAFKGIKSDYKVSVREWQNKPENINKPVTKFNFCQLLKNVLAKSDRTETIKNSFRKCGLFPFNPDAVDYSRCIQTTLEHLNETIIHPSAIPSQQSFEEAKKVVEFVKEKLLQTNINPVTVINIITEAQNSINPDVNLNTRENDVNQSCDNYETYINFGNDIQIIEDIEIEDNKIGTYVLDDNSGQLQKISSDVDALDNVFAPSSSHDNLVLRTQQTSEPLLELSQNYIEPTPSTSKFQKLLPIPKPFPKTSVRTKQKFPMCISSATWKDHYKGIENSTI